MVNDQKGSIMYIENKIRPYLVSGGYPTEDAWHFFTPKGEMKIEGCNEFFTKLFPLCNGRKTINEIGEYFAEEDDFNRIMDALMENQILVDCNRIYEVFYAYSRNPMPFWEEMTLEETCAFVADGGHLPKAEGEIFNGGFSETKLRGFMDKRCSTRNFQDASVDKATIFSMLWSAYGVQEKRVDGESQFLERTYTVPSGGALYPLMIYLIILKPCSLLAKGVYRWHKEKSFLEMVKLGDFSLEVAVTIYGISSVEKAAGILCVVADFERSARKYGNKAYNLIQQEVGHVMQNVALFCAENNLGVVEIGGYDDEHLADLINVDFPKKAPLIVAAFGEKE